MKWSFNSETDESGRKTNGKFDFLGQSYTYEEDKLIFLLGGFALTSIFSLVFIGILCILFVLITTYSSALISIIALVVSALIILSFVGAVKYLITGDPRPFVKIKSDENSMRVTFMEW